MSETEVKRPLYPLIQFPEGVANTKFGVLVQRLLKDYGPEHDVVHYLASQYSTVAPVIERYKLRDFENPDVAKRDFHILSSAKNKTIYLAGVYRGFGTEGPNGQCVLRGFNARTRILWKSRKQCRESP